ncbi:dihydrofolate reductase family protein [Actinomadura flavalba]|uniref:dihydrofolate reductase family protein n=1 Tax=Actinomadura flavalba TaxID=1120938 RepID=UPI00037A5495|nr:dihydrofolate reductase family protein [Actinomadura flavalba]
MRRLLPEPATDTDPWTAYADPPPLRIGMVTSADGSVTDAEGWTNGIGGDADFRVFRVLRALSDAILVGAATARTGRLGPARLRADLRERRGAPPAPIVVFTRTLDLDWTLPLFTAAETQTLVVTSRRAARPGVPATVIEAGDDDVDLALACRLLREEHGLDRLLCEGGPGLATALINADLADELCLNIAPTLHGTAHHTRMLGALTRERPLTTSALYVDEDVLFVRYRLGCSRASHA